MNVRFQNRAQAGQLLADKLTAYAGQERVVVFGLPRGGVPVAFEVARKLQIPLHAFLVRKLGVPGQEELAMGAIATGGICLLNNPMIQSLGISQRAIDEVREREQRVLERGEKLFQIEPPPDVRDHIVILVDDGLATGATMQAAVAALRPQHPARIVVAAPVAAEQTCREFKCVADEIVCVLTPPEFEGVGQWYKDFSQTTDEEVRALLEQGAIF